VMRKSKLEVEDSIATDDSAFNTMFHESSQDQCTEQYFPSNQSFRKCGLSFHPTLERAGKEEEFALSRFVVVNLLEIFPDSKEAILPNHELSSIESNAQRKEIDRNVMLASPRMIKRRKFKSPKTYLTSTSSRRALQNPKPG